MGHHFKKFGQNFLFGNFLTRGASQPEAPVTTPKRLNESALENPPKRPRTEDDAGHEILSTPSSSGLPEKSVAASSAQRKGAHEVLSLRSSADRSANGKGLEEYRNTEHRGGIGKNTRQRRRDKPRRSSDGPAEDGSEACLQKMNSSARYNSRHLLSLRKPSDDPIQDDEEEELDVTTGPAARASMVNGRPNTKKTIGNTVYTTSRFVGVNESDDELGVEQPAQANSRSQKQTGSSGKFTNGIKRPATIEIDEESQVLPAAKRRTQYSNRADMQRTNFASSVARVGDGRGGLRVTKAVCEPSYVYLAEGGMHGANNKKCVLVSRAYGDSPFEAVDPVTRKPIGDLVWLTPKTSKVKQISCPRNSLTVKIAKSLDATAEFKTGAVLFLQFGNAHEAERFVNLFCSVCDITVKDRDMEM